MRKFTKKMTAILIACLGIFTIQAQTSVGDLSSLDDFGGTSVGDLSGFNYILTDFTLEVEGTAGQPVSIADGLIQYTPEADGTIRFAQKDRTIFVFENRVYKGELTRDDSKITFADIFGAADNKASATGIYDAANLIQNPGFETNKAGTANYVDGTYWDVFEDNYATAWNNRSGTSIRKGSWVEGEYYMLMHKEGVYLTQELTAGKISPNTYYKVAYNYKSNDGGQGNATYRVELGTARFASDIYESVTYVTPGNTNTQTFSTTFSTGNSVLPENPVHFCIHRTVKGGNNANQNLDILDRVTLVAGSFTAGISGASSATFLSGTAYAPEVDKTALENKIAEAAALLDNTKPGYNALNAAIGLAQDVNSDPDATLAEVLDAVNALNAAILAYADATLAELKVNETILANFNPSTLSYTYVVAPEASVPTVEATVAASEAGASLAIVNASDISEKTVITVTAGNGATQVYTIGFAVNYMYGWDDGNTPNDAGWNGPEGNAITWGTENNNQVSWRRNVGDPINNGSDPMIYTTLQSTVLNYEIGTLPAKKIYQLSGKIWRRNGGETTADFKFGVATDILATDPLLQYTYSVTGNNKAGSFTSTEFVVSPSVAAPVYLLWEVVVTDNWQNAGLYDLVLVETGDAIEVAFDSNSGSPVDPQYLLTGGNAKVTEPADPIRAGYIFEGWYTDTTWETEWDFEAMTVSADVTLYAKWSNTITLLENESAEQGIRIFTTQNGVNIIAGQPMEVKVLAVTGQLVKTKEISAGETFIPLSTGMYIINGIKVLVK